MSKQVEEIDTGRLFYSKNTEGYEKYVFKIFVYTDITPLESVMLSIFSAAPSSEKTKKGMIQELERLHIKRFFKEKDENGEWKEIVD